MPYKSEKIRLTEKQDRRRKLTTEQKAEIVQLYQTGLHSLRSLGRQFGVDKSYIKILVDPERAEVVKTRIKEHWQDYVPTNEEHAEIMREHRHYKQGLYLKGELKNEDERTDVGAVQNYGERVADGILTTTEQPSDGQAKS